MRAGGCPFHRPGSRRTAVGSPQRGSRAHFLPPASGGERPAGLSPERSPKRAAGQAPRQETSRTPRRDSEGPSVLKKVQGFANAKDVIAVVQSVVDGQ